MLQTLTDFCIITSFSGLVLLEVEADEVFSRNIKPVQMLDSSFSAKDVLIDDKSRSFSLWRVSFPDLSQPSIFAKNIVELISRNLIR